MFKGINVALDIGESRLSKQIREDLASLKSVTTVENLHIMASAPETPPHIVIIYDRLEYGDIFKKISAVRQRSPHVFIFVISADKRPEHIVDVMKAGAAEFFLNPLDFQSLKDAIKKVGAGLLNDGKSSKGTVYSFMSSKGGVGSTVVSVNVAAALALRNNGSVALFDYSLQSGDSGVLLDIVPQTTIADVCRNYHRLDSSVLKGAMTSHATGLHFLAAPTEPEESTSIHGEHVHRILELAVSLYDNILIDCTSMYVDECTAEAFQASQRIFVLVDQSVPAVRNAARLIQLIKKLGIDGEKIEVVLNRFIKDAVPSLHDIEKTIGRRIPWLFPNKFKEIVASINQGVPIVKGQPGSAFAKNIEEFIEKLKNWSEYETYRGQKSFFGKLL